MKPAYLTTRRHQNTNPAITPVGNGPRALRLMAAGALVAVVTMSPASPAHAAWGPFYTIQRAGLYDAAHTGSAGFYYNEATSLGAGGEVAGYARRITDVSTVNGQNTWVHNPATGLTVLTGLTSAAHTGSAGYQSSVNSFPNDSFHSTAGQIAGYSRRILGVNTSNGQNTWVYDPVTNTTIPTGMTGVGYTGADGYQNSGNDFQNKAGQVAGFSSQYTAQGVSTGSLTWIYNPTTHATVRIGLTGAAYTGSEGYQSSTNNKQNAAGHVVGTSRRYTGITFPNGTDTWFYNPATGQTVLTGLTDAAHTSSSGSRESTNEFLNDAGQVAGSTKRPDTGATVNGRNTWVYVPATGATVVTGLTDAAHTGSTGYQTGQNTFQSASGVVSGFSSRITGVSTLNGQNTWAYNPTNGASTKTGLTEAAHTDSGGYQFSGNDLQNDVGHVAGHSLRFTSQRGDNGRNTWTHNPATGATVQTGLTGASYTGSAGYQVSWNNLQNTSGQIAGYSRRITGVNTIQGQNTWVYSPATGATVMTGLTGAAQTGNLGAQESTNDFQNAAGHVSGSSLRYTGTGATNGLNTWLYDPITGSTVQTGLVDAVHTNSRNSGYQYSKNTHLNEAGQVAGYSQRYLIPPVADAFDAWYFDPADNISRMITQGVPGSVRSSDGYALSQVRVLTDNGFALGSFMYFPGGVGSGEARGFLYRPDVGFHLLADLVIGGLQDTGWTRLGGSTMSNLINEIVGFGALDNQPYGSASVFVLVPAPGTGVLGALGLTLLRRRR